MQGFLLLQESLLKKRITGSFRAKSAKRENPPYGKVRRIFFFLIGCLTEPLGFTRG